MKKTFFVMAAAVFMIAAIGAAAAAESPDAGDTPDTARYMTISYGYNYIYGGFTAPSDMVDWWAGSDPQTGNTVEAYLNSASLNNGVIADTYCKYANNSSDLFHMEHLEKGNMHQYNVTMIRAPYFLRVNGTPGLGNWDYTAIVYRS